MAQATYQVKLFDHLGEQVALFVGSGRESGGGLRGFTYVKRVRTAGQHVLRIDGEDERIALFRQDYFLEWWRRDPVGGLDWYKDFTTFHRSWSYEQDKEGRLIYISRGRGLNDLLSAEPVQYASGSAFACKTMEAERAAKRYVNQNIGPTAVPADRRMPGLTVQAEAGTGAVWSGCRAYKPLLDVLQELADYGPGDFMIVNTGLPTFQFQWRDNQWGADVRKGQPSAVVFSGQNRNATNIKLNISHLDEVNVCYVLGQGEADTRTIETVEDAALLAASPWARRAVARDARNEDAAAGLIDKGEATLDKQRPVISVAFDALQTTSTRYGRDWDVGYLVTVESRGQEVGQKITGVMVSMDEDGGESISPETEDLVT